MSPFASLPENSLAEVLFNVLTILLRLGDGGDTYTII